MQIFHKELMPGVSLTSVHTDKFKSSMISATFLCPLARETAAANALLPMVLCRGSADRPDMSAISAALDDLYGGSVEPAVRKKGETQCIGLTGSFLDDSYAPGDADILGAATGLMGELFLRPLTVDGAFHPGYVEGEKQNLADRIRAQINEKRQYSILRVSELMCREEAYGIDKFGEEAQALAMTPQLLWEQYQQLLGQAALHLFYCGSAGPERVEGAFLSAFSALPRNEHRVRASCVVLDRPTPGAPHIYEDRMDVVQGKLALGFRTGGGSGGGEQLPALMMFSTVLGGSTTSKLFMNVRERLSLCYFANTILEKNKGILLVSSGVEFEKFGQAEKEILKQLQDCKDGKIDGQELEGARRALVTRMKTALDSQPRLEDHWLDQAVAGGREGPEELAGRMELVTLGQVVAAAGKTELDTVYYLTGKEG